MNGKEGQQTTGHNICEACNVLRYHVMTAGPFQSLLSVDCPHLSRLQTKEKSCLSPDRQLRHRLANHGVSVGLLSHISAFLV